MRHRQNPASRVTSHRHLTPALALAGGAAITLSQRHILPPMLCFAVLVTGLLAVGAAALLAVDRYLPRTHGQRQRPRAAAPVAMPAHRHA